MSTIFPLFSDKVTGGIIMPSIWIKIFSVRDLGTGLFGNLNTFETF